MHFLEQILTDRDSRIKTGSDINTLADMTTYQIYVTKLFNKGRIF